MAQTRRKHILNWVEQVLVWVASLGITALLMYLAADSASSWVGWVTLVLAVLSVVATVILFNARLRDKVVTVIWRLTKPKV